MSKSGFRSKGQRCLKGKNIFNRAHFSQEQIKINATAPSFFLTKKNKTLLTEENGDLTERGRTIISQTPMRRFGNPEDLNGAVLWLCSEASTFVTGIVLPVDGGFTAFSGV